MSFLKPSSDISRRIDNHSQLRSLRRLDDLHKKRVIEVTDKTLVTFSLNELPIFIEQINTNNYKSIMSGLQGIKRILFSDPQPVTELCESGILPRLAQLLSGDIYTVNLVVTIFANLATTYDERILDQFFYLHVCEHLAKRLCDPFKMANINIF
ncbi:Uncharacterized protein QTN25_003256 [Entamoeba marina]